jgi:RNA polymerase sigma factor FliA
VTSELDRLTEELMPQARSEAWRMFSTAPQQLDLGELTSWAYMGLAQARDRWPDYCASRGYSPEATQYFAAYALRRIRGSMYDSLRKLDWVSRSTRRRAKDLREAGQDLGAGEAELAQRTGLSPQQIRTTVAAVARRPVSLDAEPVDVPDSDDVEGQAAVSIVLSAAVLALRRQHPDVQAVIALRYHQDRDVQEIAELFGRSRAEVEDLHTAGVLAVHAAMLSAVAESPG